jgi:large exoprotein involved in heme utilization and adhesion
MITMASDPDVAVMILERSRLTAQASEGRGGNMRIVTDLFIPSAPPLTVVSASSEFGLAGEIQIGGPDASILATLNALPAVFMDAAGLIRESCVAQHQEAGASLLVRGRGGLPPAPGGLLPGSEANLDASLLAGRPEYSAAVIGATRERRPVLLAVRCGN